MNSSWRRVTRTRLCPICDHPDWCRVAEDGAWAICRRLDTGEGMHKIDKTGVDYWLYRLDRTSSPAPNHPEPQGQPTRTSASDEVLDQVYRALLASLPLSGIHHARLHQRGLPDAEIRRRQYRTLPAQRRAELAGGLVDRFNAEVCRHIPGLYLKDDRGRRWWSLAGAAGLVIPIRTQMQQIVALSVRADDPASETRYSFISSSKYRGTGPGARLHWPLYEGHITECVRLTEGALKGDVATALSGQLTLGLPGVSSWQQAIPLLRQHRVRCVRLAFDADACRNIMVARALKAATKHLTAAQILV
jgi:DNA primase